MVNKFRELSWARLEARKDDRLSDFKILTNRREEDTSE